jgi:TRAP-type C4-dicarboxylate transport system permease small subunit
MDAVPLNRGEKRMKLGKLTNSVIPIFGGVLLAIIVGLTFLQIVFRQFFNFTLNWSDEVAQICMTWLALFGSVWAIQNNQHLSAGIKLHQKFTKKQIYLIDGILALVICGTLAVVVYQNIMFVFSALNTESLSLPWLKMGYIFLALPLTMFALCCYYLKSFFRNITRIFKKD